MTILQSADMQGPEPAAQIPQPVQGQELDDNGCQQTIYVRITKLEDDLKNERVANSRMWSNQRVLAVNNQTLVEKNQNLVKENQRLNQLNQERINETREFNVLQKELERVKALNAQLMQEMSSQTEHVYKLYAEALTPHKTRNEYIVSF